MRVSMLVLNNFTHDARVHKEAKALASVGHKVTVVALWQAGLPEQEMQAGYQVKRLRLRSRPWRGRLIAPLVKYLEFAFRAWRLSEREPAQVYHAHDAATLPAAWIAARRGESYLVYDAHELETGRNFGSSRLAGVYQRVWAWPEIAFIRQADTVLTVGNGIADELIRLYGIHRPWVVMNCPERQPLLSRSTRLRDELALPLNLKVALYLGKMIAGRGLEPFLEAVQRLPGVAAVVLGDGPLLPEFQSRVKSGVWQRVYLPGRVPLADLIEYAASADIGVALIQDICRSYQFALPNKLFEYMQAGIPVVGSNLPEISRIISAYQVGEIVDPNDPEDIASGIRRLIDDRERYARAKANVSRAATTFNWEQESKKLLDIYRRFACTEKQAS
jgi:glycosyltransferase involved in cell wall biosynthesis